MFRTYILTILLILLVSSSPGQNRVMDASELTGLKNVRFMPDVEGKVVVHENYLNDFQTVDLRNEIELFPGWPLIAAGSNECGSIYANLDDDEELELVYPVGTALLGINPDGTAVPGWPKTLDFPTDGAAAYGDIDGDGDGEIVVTTHQIGSFAFGTIYAFENDGSNVNGFPVATEGGGVKTPTLADLDGDDALEIIITVRNWPDGLVAVYTGAGDIFPGWPVRMDYVPGSAAAVGDINGDEIPEIVAESYYGLHAFTPDGALVDGFPYYPGLGRVFSYSTPVLADLDDDGNREIICGDHSTENGSGAVHIVDYTGTSWVQWPKITVSWIYGSPAIGDINDDGLLDIAVGDQTLSSTPVNKLYAWTALTGEPLPGFPVTEVSGINCQLLLADLDGDGMIELLADDNISVSTQGQYPGFNHDGTRMEDFFLETLGSTFFINPVIMDINHDGNLDISGGGLEPGSNMTSLYLWDAGVTYDRSLAILPVLQYNTRHNGVYGDTLMVKIYEKPSEDKSSWSVYPVPATDYLYISSNKFDNQQDIRVEIYQANGILISDQKIRPDDGLISLDIKNFPAGFYWISISINKDKRQIEKFVKI